MTVTVIPRPATIDGCVSSWQEQEQSGVIRSTMDSGAVKVRRRFTGQYSRAACEMRLLKGQYGDFVKWYADTLSGLYASWIVGPDQQEHAWRLIAPPVLRFQGPDMFVASLELERFGTWP